MSDFDLLAIVRLGIHAASPESPSLPFVLQSEELHAAHTFGLADMNQEADIGVGLVAVVTRHFADMERVHALDDKGLRYIHRGLGGLAFGLDLEFDMVAWLGTIVETAGVVGTLRYGETVDVKFTLIVGYLLHGQCARAEHIDVRRAVVGVPQDIDDELGLLVGIEQVPCILLDTSRKEQQEYKYEKKEFMLHR